MGEKLYRYMQVIVCLTVEFRDKICLIEGGAEKL